jgi:hypothetical protein
LQEYYASATAKGERQKAKGTEKKKPQGKSKKSKA